MDALDRAAQTIPVYGDVSKMQTKNPILISTLALCIAGALAAGQAEAAGFQLKENSVKAQGRSYAGTGVAEGDASVVANNPAAMTTFEGTTVQSDITVIDLGFQFKGSGFAGTGTPLARPMTGGDGGGAGGVTPVPAMSVIHKFDNGLAVGAMISAPFGLKTEYDRGWVGRYRGLKSEVKTIDLTVSAAYEIVPDRFSVGAGFIYEKADVTLSSAVDFGSLLAFSSLPGFAPQSADGELLVNGENHGFGYIVGATFTPIDQLKFGISHRSEIDHDLEGSADWSVPGSVRSVFNSIGRASFFNDGKVKAKLTTPSITTFSASYAVNDSLMILADYSNTDWSSVKEVRIDFLNPDPDSVEDFSWTDTTFMSIGAEYKLSDTLTVRGGFAYDETPTTFRTRTPRLPDEDRRWYSFGVTWKASDSLEVTGAYTFIDPDTPKIGINDSSRHTIFGEYESSVNLFGVSGQFKF
jgi:long-chain fatty acid transport protein